MRRIKISLPYFIFHLAHIFLNLVRFMTQVFSVSVFAPKKQKCHSNDSENIAGLPRIQHLEFPHMTFSQYNQQFKSF